MSEQVDFFVSYTGVDVAWAEWIAYVLEDAGLVTLLQAWDFRPGSNFVVEMNDALQRSHRLLPVLSDSYLRSAFATSEWAGAFANDPIGRDRRLLPVRVEQCEPDGLLRSVVYVDLVGLEEPAARSRLMAGLTGGRAKPAHAPFPGVRHPAAASRPFPGKLPTIPIGAASPLEAPAGDIGFGIDDLTDADPLVFFPAIAQLNPSLEVFEAALVAQHSPAHTRAVRSLLARDRAMGTEFLLEIIRTCSTTQGGWFRARAASQLFSPPLDAASDELWEMARGWEPEHKRHALVALGNLGSTMTMIDLREHALNNEDAVAKALSYAVKGAVASYLLASRPYEITSAGRHLRELLTWEYSDRSVGYPKTTPELWAASSGHYDDLIEAWITGAPEHASAALNGLGERAVVRAVPAIAELLNTVEVRESAGLALGRIGGRDAAMLLDALSWADPVRPQLVHVIHELPDDRFDAAVEEFSKRGAEWQQGWMVRSIGLRRAMKHRELVRRTLSARLPAVRGCAALAAAQLGINFDFDQFVREAVPGEEQAMGLAAVVRADPSRYPGLEQPLRRSLVRSITGAIPSRIVEDIFQAIGTARGASELVAAWRPVAESWGARL